MNTNYRNEEWLKSEYLNKKRTITELSKECDGYRAGILDGYNKGLYELAMQGGTITI